MSLLRYILMLALLIVASTATAVAHPAEGQVLNEQQLSYGSFYPSDWSWGDIVFPAAEDFPALETLTPLEKYMLCGTLSSLSGPEIGYSSWQMQITSFVMKFYKANGYIPTELSLDLIRQTPGYEDMPSVYYDLLRNPLTDNWPKLNASSLSPGDVYIRALTPDEVQYFAGFNNIWNDVWINRVVPPGFDDAGQPLRSVSTVYYFRMWGYAGPLRAQFMYTFTH